MPALIKYHPPGYSWPLRFIYAMLFIITKIALRVYYRRIAVIGRENLPDTGATILISNHPNTLLDPLQVASRIKRQVFFLANAGLFQNKILGPILRTFYCIPIERPQDVEGRVINNEQNFLECYQHLYYNGVIYIAPEGISVQARTQLPLKTGTARIALGCVAHFDNECDVKIVTVGLHYSSPLKFRSDVVVRIGQPISTIEWIQNQPDTPVSQRSRVLTHALQQQLEKLKITAHDAAEENALSLLETIARTDYPNTIIAEDERSRVLLEKLQSLDNLSYTKSIKNCADYQHHLEQEDASDFQLFGKKPWWKYVLTIALAPLGVWGILNNLLAFGLPYLIRKRIKTHESYNATVQFLGGIFTLPLAYGFQTYLVAKYSTPVVACLYLVSLPILGWIGWEWKMLLGRYFRPYSKSIAPELVRLRSELKKQFLGDL